MTSPLVLGLVNYLSGKRINVDTTLAKDFDAMMTINYRTDRPNLE
jgi:hypothetical protein